MTTSLGIAWRQLSHNRMKLIAALSGVVVAVLLMLMQLGFLSAAYDSVLAVPRCIRADLVVVSPRQSTMFRPVSFSRRHLYRMPADADVERVQGVYIGIAQWRDPWSKREEPILVFGLEPGKSMLDLPGVDAAATALASADTLVFDEASRNCYGPVPQAWRGGEAVEPEVNRRRVKVVGLTRLGVTMAGDGNAVVSQPNFLRLNPGRAPGAIDLGLVKLKPGADAAAAKARLAAFLGPEVCVLTGSEFVDQEYRYVRDSQPIHFIFSLGAAAGFFIGFVIVYQILYTDVAHHLPQFGTLKAVGFTDGYLLRLIMLQSLILSFLGYWPGVLLAWGLYVIARDVTFLPVQMTPERVAAVLALTVVMCLFSGAMAVSKLRSIDPAEVF